jgi:Mrp family chromosome partitioning ATPase
VNGELLGLMGLVEGADVTPTTQAVAASEQVQRTLAEVLSRWSEVKDKDVKALNEQLRQANIEIIDIRRL